MRGIVEISDSSKVSSSDHIKPNRKQNKIKTKEKKKEKKGKETETKFRETK